MIESQPLKPATIKKNLLEFIWRMRASAEFHQRITKYFNLVDDVERIKRLGLKQDPVAAYKLIKSHEEELRDILVTLQKQNMSAFHKDTGVN